MNTGYFLTGSNVGDKLANLHMAKSLVEQSVGKVVNQSSIYETAAWGNNNQPDFLNQVLLVETKLSAEDCMQEILLIEKTMGRIRTVKNASRVIDIDVLFFNKDVIQQDGLTIPHPEIQNRKFALIPMNELSSELIHPIYKKSIRTLLSLCTDELEVKAVINF